MPDRLDELLATGAVEACGPDRYCIPSPSLVQLAVAALGAGYASDQVLALLRTRPPRPQDTLLPALAA